MQLSQPIRDLIASGPFAHLTTLNADGSPQVTVVWVGIRDDAFVIGHMAEHQKVRNMRRDSRVVLSMLGPHTNEDGLREYVVVNGDAEITEGGAAALIGELAKTYLGPDVRSPAEGDTRPGVVTHIRPKRIAGIGPWAE